MDLIDIKCKNCGADLKVSPDSDIITCLQCQTSFSVRDMINNTSNNYVPNNYYSDNINNNMQENNNNYQNNNMNPNNVNNNNNNNNNGGNRPTKKKKTKKKNTKKIFLYIFFIGIIIASGVVYYLDKTKKPEEPEIYDNLPSEIITDEKDKKDYQVEAATLKLAPDVDLAAEREKYHNNDIIGRLEIPDLFNVLVVKGTDNGYYLSHAINKEYDIRGTEFMDYRNYPTDKQVNIYGHNTRDPNIKVAFLKLEKFLNSDFFDNNQYIVFQYDGGKSIYKIISMKEVYESNNEHMAINKTGLEFLAHMEKLTTGDGVRNSRTVNYDENSEIIVLQTCSHHWDNAVYIITAVKL